MEQVPSRQATLLRSMSMVVFLGLLVGIALVARSLNPATVGPLNPNDAMSIWSDASEAQKKATAAAILDQLRRDEKLSRQTKFQMETQRGFDTYVEDLVAAMDLATNKDVKNYVSPGASMIDTAKTIISKKGWDL